MAVITSMPSIASPYLIGEGATAGVVLGAGAGCGVLANHAGLVVADLAATPSL